MKRKGWEGGVAGAVLALVVLPGGAAELRPTVRVGYDVGGDTLATVVYTDGKTRDIRSGEGLVGAVGASLTNDARSLELEAMVSFKTQFVFASNGDVTWTRYPVDVLGFYRFSKVRVGGGVTYHLSPRVNGEGAASNVDLDFKSAVGGVVQADFLFSGAESSAGAYLGVRYTSLEYEASQGGAKVRGESLGLHIGYRF